MSKKKIISIGFDLASDEAKFSEFSSDISLLDWDIIFFKPNIGAFLDYSNMYQGKASLSDYSSFRLKERVEHWRREIKDAVENGKLVIIYLSDLTEVYIDTGRREHSGTGRNRATTRIVDTFDNYKCIPAALTVTNRKGSEMKLASKGAEILSSYWQEFEDASNYRVILEGKDIPVSITTKTGDKPVGAMYRSKSSSGAMLLLPDIDFYPSEFFEEVDIEEGVEEHWTDKAVSFSSRLIKEAVSIDKSLKTEGENTPEPQWATSSKYSLNKEKEFKSNLLTIETKLEGLQAQKEELLEQLRDAGKLRWLLYEKGKPLEFVIVDALRMLGFKAEQFEDGESEFDAVFESKEGRLIGEAEGKDNKAINITKLRQLALNIHEDLERDEVDEPAKGVLFGNAYRLKSIEERENPFTDKCVSASRISSTALVSTTDLFKVAQYLSNKKDASFAKKCRLAIIDAIGRVDFPEVPEMEKNQETDTIAD